MMKNSLALSIINRMTQKMDQMNPNIINIMTKYITHHELAQLSETSRVGYSIVKDKLISIEKNYLNRAINKGYSLSIMNNDMMSLRFLINHKIPIAIDDCCYGSLLTKSIRFSNLDIFKLLYKSIFPFKLCHSNGCYFVYFGDDKNSVNEWLIINARYHKRKDIVAWFESGILSRLNKIIKKIIGMPTPCYI